VAERPRGRQDGPAAACVVRHCGARAFRIEGHLDASGAEKLLCGTEAEINASGTSDDLVLDLADLASADGSGADALAEIAGRLDGDLILLSPQPTVAQVLRTAKICERFPNVVVFCTHRPCP
jgi:anti-anti-sigma regulatory factor